MYDIKLVEKLALEEGLNDREISEILNCSRVTITRIRKRNNIPLCDKSNRKDKVFTCVKCGEKIRIRRKEYFKAFCDKCTETL